MKLQNALPALLFAVLAITESHSAAPVANPLDSAQLQKAESDLVIRYGEAQRSRAHRGIAQVATLWRNEDGDAAALQNFVSGNFAGDQKAQDALFARFSHNLEMLYGHTHEIAREFNTPSDLDTGPLASYDETFAAWDPYAHIVDDMFSNKLAFTALLNFPLTSLEERTKNGPTWSRRQWAEARIAEKFRDRVPAEANQAANDAYTAGGRYIAGYNIWMHHLVDAKGQRIFPAGVRLLSHWNLRDELKSNYSDGKAALPKQRMIQRVMERIVAQEIPAIVVDNPLVDWDPYTNAVTRAAVKDSPEGAGRLPAATGAVDSSREPDSRYAIILGNFHGEQQLDKYSPLQNTYITRAFENERQLAEQRVQAMFEQVLGSPEVARTGKLIARRLGRKLEPFDIWYNGFRARGQYTEAALDEIVQKKYPTAAAYKQDIPQILRRLGFAADRADYVARHIEVDPARGSGHAMGAEMSGVPAHLRTRVEKNGMNYKGYNIAVHEMCHNVEQTFSMNDIDFYPLHGVPNTAFTEALAFTCQARDLELLGLSKPDARSRAMHTLDDFWGMYEIGGVALVDMGVWRWMYAHPQGTPAQLREATLGIARDIWNRWYAPVFGVRDVTLLAIYSHMVNERLYLPDYPIGHMIAFQVEAQMDKAGDFGREFERVARIGAVSPDMWMTQAAGAPVGPDALLKAADVALGVIEKE
jgi:hypothetical protein